MKVSLNIIKQFTSVDLPVNELVQKINQQLGGVEEVIDLGAKYKDTRIVKVLSAQKHPNADKLSLCIIDDGGVVEGVERDENGHVQVVCGAPNVHSDMYAIWLPPKSTVPASYDTAEPFVLEARELRGLMSNGMLASAKELGLGDDHSGIVEINPDEWRPNTIELKPGASFAQVYGLDDTIIDIENKMFTHRPDLFGQLGVAREIAGIQNKAFTSPDWYKVFPEFNRGEGLELHVENKASALVPRFMAVAIKDVQVKPSPLWLQCALVAMGSKAINNIVDVTNYVMLLTAQPTHAYDYDKLRGHFLGTRMAEKGEEVPLLNGKTYTLDESDIVIVDGEGPVGLAGVMGGGNSEVSETTKNIVLEVANFDMYAVRKSSMKYGLFTDALTRFNKGQSPLQNANVVNLLMMSIHDVAGGAQASEVFDQTASQHKAQQVTTSDEFINARLGLNLSSSEINGLLTNVEFEINPTEGERTFSAPFWRTDIVDPEDIVEEVGRLYGFDKLPRELPLRSTKPAPKNAVRSLKQNIRGKLAKAGANEVLTYSFVHENVMQKAGQDTSHAYRLSNALSPDLQFYRLSVMSSLLDKVHMNFRAGHDAFALYELGKTHFKGEMDEHEPSVPNEDSLLAFIVTNGKKKSTESAYYQAQAYLQQLIDLSQLNIQPLSEFDTSTDEWGAQLVAPYAPKRSAVIMQDGKIWGVLGEFSAATKAAFKLPEYTAGFEVHIDVLKNKGHGYKPLSRYPSTWQDISLKVNSDVQYADIFAAAKNAVETTAPEIDYEITPISIYQSEDDTSHKTITLRVKLTHHERTLKEKDASAVIEAIASGAGKSLNASVA